MFDSVLGAISAEMAIDLGTSTVRVFQRGRGVVACEPAVVAIREDADGSRRIVAVGAAAAEMDGRTPPDVRVVRPVRGGEVADFEVTQALLRRLMTDVQGRRLWLGPRVVMAVGHGTTDVEQRAVRDALEASGAREVLLIERPLAAACGAGLPVREAQGQMVIDMGGGTTEVSVVSLGGVVYTRTLRLGGEDLDAAVVQAVAEQTGLHIGRSTAEALRHSFGCTGDAQQAAEIRGRSAATGFPMAVEVQAGQIHSAMATPLRMVVDAVVATLEHTPPDLAADVAETGLVLAGGCAAMTGLAGGLSQATGLPVVVPDDPVCSTVVGAAQLGGRPMRALATG